MSSDTVLCWAILTSVTYFDSRRCKNAAKTSKNWQEQSSRKVPNLIEAQCYAYSQCAVPVPNQYVRIQRKPVRKYDELRSYCHLTNSMVFFQLLLTALSIISLILFLFG